ncbi:hypothetical protein [Niallia circulans]|uniref:hypothetical protein n=1 Tax=Niallia circulans TaxID=1397 RepID=UPI00352D22FC
MLSSIDFMILSANVEDFPAGFLFYQPNLHSFQPNFRFISQICTLFSQTSCLSAKTPYFSAKLPFYQPKRHSFQPNFLTTNHLHHLPLFYKSV